MMRPICNIASSRFDKPVIGASPSAFSVVSNIMCGMWMNTQMDSVGPLGQTLCFLHAETQTNICIYAHNGISYLVEALQPLLHLSQRRVRTANFDLRVLPLGMQTISYDSASVAVKSKRGSKILRENP